MMYGIELDCQGEETSKYNLDTGERFDAFCHNPDNPDEVGYIHGFYGALGEKRLKGLGIICRFGTSTEDFVIDATFPTAKDNWNAGDEVWSGTCRKGKVHSIQASYGEWDEKYREIVIKKFRFRCSDAE